MEYTQLPQDSLPESSLTDLSVISSSDVVARRRHLLWYLEESIQEIEDDEIIMLVTKCLEAFGLKMQTA